MALGINLENQIYTVFSIPLIREDKNILVNHLRMLANALEEYDLTILSARLKTPLEGVPYSKPSFEIVCFGKNNGGPYDNK